MVKIIKLILFVICLANPILAFSQVSFTNNSGFTAEVLIVYESGQTHKAFILKGCTKYFGYFFKKYKKYKR
jgi:hypothetical protein